MKRGDMIRRQILRDVHHHPNDIASHIASIFGITRQAVNRHLQILVEGKWLHADGATRNRIYTLGDRREHTHSIDLTIKNDEYQIYSEHFAWVIKGIPENIEDIVVYGFTEMVNNAIDHSEGSRCSIRISRTLEAIQINISDNGEGIFKRITRLCSLADERQAIIELSKGKLTTDPQNHSGQGIFFTSRMYDDFVISSTGLEFAHHDKLELDVLSDDPIINKSDTGTDIFMSIRLDSKRTDKEIFDKYSGSEEDDYSFNKTIVPVRLAQFPGEQLVSRSQAKRLLTRIENFKNVIFDFSGVDKIGQAFSDEIFRVYKLKHPTLNIVHVNANEDVTAMINRAKSS